MPYISEQIAVLGTEHTSWLASFGIYHIFVLLSLMTNFDKNNCFELPYFLL